ncbi:MAG: trimethylamine methyltransferase family protein [Planctomycetota bacterium]|jgi:trimethylamine--corrinoid protein Co-methyltransferase
MNGIRPKVRWLSDETVEAILSEAKRVLAEIGVFVENETAAAMLLDAGCRKDPKGERILIDGALVEKALATAPSCVRLYDREGAEAMVLEGDNIHFNPGSAALHVYDAESHTIRDGGIADLVAFAALTDRLPHYAAQSTGIIPGDVPEDLADRTRLFVALTCCTKPVVTGTFRIEAFSVMREMLTVIRGSAEALSEKPLAIFDCCPSPPLKWSDLTCQSLLDCADSGQPAELVSMPLTGATAPVTLSGALVQHAAECFSGVVIHQLRKPGAPILWGGSPAFFDMRKGTTPMGAFETMMIDGAYAQIGKTLGLPTHAYMGLSDSKTVDYQAGFESSAGIVLAALSGVNNISGPGMMEFETCQSLEKLVLDHEVCAYAQRMVAGIVPRGEPLGFDVIREGIADGHFMALPHTKEWFKEEGYYPDPVVNREVKEKWEQGGKKRAVDAAREKVAKLKKDGVRGLLDGNRRNALREILDADAKRQGFDSLPPLPV